MTLPISRHRILNLLADAVLIAVAWRLTFWIRFDQSIPPFYRHLLSWQIFALVIGITLAVFILFGFYNRWWRYVSTRDMWGAARGVVVACLLVDLTIYLFPPEHTARLPRGMVLIAMPSASGEVRQRVVDVAREEGVPVKTLPGLNELISGDVNLAGQLRPVQVEDVLGREPVEVDLHEVAGYLAGKTVLVTGAGGSIGAELCRQIARVGAKRIILLDHSEPALFEIERELVAERGFSAALPVLADVGNRTKVRQVFEKYRPDVVFHSAAYKHVPLLEANPLEAVRNNVLATKTLADVAVEFETQRFVLVSTDKAAQPKNLLGQSKAVGEWIVQAYGSSADVPTRFVAVRFGNVLGSSGSVIPTFRKQIERGGPVTVTHREMTRYFMPIP